MYVCMHVCIFAHICYLDTYVHADATPRKLTNTYAHCSCSRANM